MHTHPDFVLFNSFPATRRKIACRNDYYLGHICRQLGYETEKDISVTLEKVFKLCRTLDIPVNENFERVFFERGSMLYPDWKITKLGMYLFIQQSGKSGNSNSADYVVG